MVANNGARKMRTNGNNEQGLFMDTNTLLIILIVLILLGGGGFYGRGRWF